ncbi:MAG: alpha-mannosyltransferase [Burkholderiales bacterium RIFCSPLOWO2_12_FULL_61_40]|nr:MAG: alpha-mannosyltransferase [Burkholderiales bacterium RIFCSPLOWO2_12_FULL_61_40]
MKLALVTDAWLPQVNGVVTTLVELVREMEGLGHQVVVIHPGLFKTRPCPGYAGIDLAVRPAKALARQLDEMAPDVVHLATEGPLGWAARRYCLQRKLAFTTAFHTRFPEILKAALKIPLWLGYAVFRHFHRPSSGVLVPTPSVLHMLHARGFKNLRSWTHGVDMQLFSYKESPEVYAPLGILARPVSLFVGRVSYEKNIDAFLKLDVPGTKVVCGVGPLETQLRERYPHVRWLGLLPRDELAQVYAAADVFVMPSQSETFGLVMLESMASGTPVAAYPVEGPLEVVGSPAQGGVLEKDLSTGWYSALTVPRHEARARAMAFSWAYASLLFLGHLVPARQGKVLDPVAIARSAVT